MAQTLKDTLKELQIKLGQPHKKITGALKYYLSFLNAKHEDANLEGEAPKVEKIQTLTHNKITWVDVKNPNRREVSELAQQYPFHPLHIEDCVSKGQYPKIELNEEDKYLFLLLRFPHFQKSDSSISINQICFFLGKNYLVTVHENTNDTISNIFNECKTNQDQRKAYINGSPAYLLYTLINSLTDDVSYLLQVILKEVDQIEEIVFDDKVSGVYKIGQLRRKILNTRRVIGPLRALLKDIATTINKFSSTNLSVYFEDIAQSLDKAWETVEQARETVDIYKDADFTISTEKTNKILTVLTIIFTLSIPATVIGAFYGTNILLPGGLDAGSWTFLGKYTTLILLVSISAILALLMHFYFRKRGWL